LATSIYNITGIAVPEYALTIVMGIGLTIMIISLVLWKPKPVLRTS
jgi:hypothetical protein